MIDGEDCIFCKILAGESEGSVVYRDQACAACLASKLVTCVVCIKEVGP